MSRKIIKAVTLKDLSAIKVDKTKLHSKKLYRIFTKMDESLDFFIWTYMDSRGTVYYDPKLDFLPIEDETSDTPQYKLRNISKINADFIRKEQIENFKWLNEHLEKKLDIAEVEKIIQEVPIKVFELDSDKIGPEGQVRGFLHKSGYIALNLKTCMKNTPEGRTLRFHEFIHLVQDKLRIKDESISRIINEAQTESLALRRGTENRSLYIGFLYSEKKAMARLNFDATHYTFSVCLLRQLEKILGRKSYEKDFISSRNFSEEFIKKYGMNLYTFIVARMETLDTNTDEAFLKGTPFYLEDTQNIIMKETFRQDFERMKTIDDAKEMLTRLRGLELERVDIYADDGHGAVKNYNQYESFYNRLYKKIGHRLLKLGYSKEEINNSLEDFKYKKQKFYPGYSDKEQEDMAIEMVSDLIEGFNNFGEQKYDSKKHTIVYLIDDKEDLYMAIRPKNCTIDDKIYVKAFYGDYSRFFYDMLPNPPVLQKNILNELKLGGRVVKQKEKVLEERES